jgi:hypothetical protein
MEVNHVRVCRGGCSGFTPLLIEVALPCRHTPGNRWFVDETYVIPRAGLGQTLGFCCLIFLSSFACLSACRGRRWVRDRPVGRPRSGREVLDANAARRTLFGRRGWRLRLVGRWCCKCVLQHRCLCCISYSSAARPAWPDAAPAPVTPGSAVRHPCLGQPAHPQQIRRVTLIIFDPPVGKHLHT